MTVAHAVYDILLRLGKQSDDADIEYRQVAQWLTTARAEVVKDYLDKSGEEIPPSMIKEYTCVCIEEDQLDCIDCNRTIVNLPISPMNLRSDLGVYQVSRVGGEVISRKGSAGLSNLLSKSRFGKIDSWFRIEDKLFLEGAYPSTMKVNVLIVPGDLGELPEDAEFPAPDELMFSILNMAEKVGRRELGTVVDINNDGKDSTQLV